MSEIRRNRILELLRVAGRMTYPELAGELDVSEETARRDIKRLEKDKLIQTVRGGVMLPEVLRETAFHYCLVAQVEEKRKIAIAAAQFVEDGDSLMIAGGSTTTYFALELASKRGLNVVTNSVDVARILVTRGGNQVHTIGGQMEPLSGSSLGVAAIENVHRYTVDKTFFSVGSVAEKMGLMCDTLDEASCWHAMMSCAENVFALVDSTKFGKRGLVKCAAFDELDHLITDKTPETGISHQLKKSKCELVVADVERPLGTAESDVLSVAV